MMDHPFVTASSDTYADIRDAVAKLCARFPGECWRDLDRHMDYPTEFVAALTEAGYLSVLIPEEYGGSGLPLSAGAAELEETQRAGCNGGACHAQMYTMERCCGMGPQSRSSVTCRRRQPESCGCRPSA